MVVIISPQLPQYNYNYNVLRTEGYLCISNSITTAELEEIIKTLFYTVF